MKYSEIDYNEIHAECPAGMSISQELSTLGHPLADLAYLCMCLRFPDLGHLAGLKGKNRKELGIPGEQDIVQQYCDLRGSPEISHWHFYLVFSFFRLAATAQGVLNRALSGNASSKQALQAGKQGRLLAEMAVELI